MDTEAEELSYELLQELVRAERRSNKLMPVPAGFWPRVRTFLSDVTQEFRQQQERDPWSRKAMLLSDEAKNAKHAAENLWALRERKLAMLALARERERKRPEGITADEAQVFDGLMHVLDRHRKAVFEGTSPTPVAPAPAATPGPPTGAVPPAGPGPSAAPSQAPAEAAPARASAEQDPHSQTAPTPPPAPDPAPAKPPAAPSPAPSPAEGTPAPPAIVPADQDGQEPVVTIRALGDIPPFVGPDMQTYLLKEGDLATVPPTIAQLLVKRKKAAVVEGI